MLIDEKKFELLIREAQALKDEDTMQTFIHELRDAYGLKHILFSATGIVHSDVLYNLTTIPEKWMRLYRDNNLNNYDPVRRLAKEGAPIHWEHIKTINPLEAFVLRQRRKVVGTQALTIPLISTDENTSAISFIGKDDEKDWFKKINNLYPEFRQLGMILHATVLRNLGLTPPAIILSSRHIDCLQMLASGMNENQIASFLTISERSVKQYIGEAKLRLRARNKVQAVAAAITLGILSTE